MRHTYDPHTCDLCKVGEKNRTHDLMKQIQVLCQWIAITFRACLEQENRWENPSSISIREYNQILKKIIDMKMINELY